MAAPILAPPTALGSEPGIAATAVERLLQRDGRLGLLTVCVLERQGRRVEGGWPDYEALLAAVGAFLRGFAQRQMRSGDLLFEPQDPDTRFLMFLNPPRRGRPLDLMDLGQVRHRLSRGLNRQLWDTLPKSVIHRFGTYVGATLLEHEPAVDPRRIVQRGIDAAFADALLQKHAEPRRQVVRLQRILRTGAIEAVYQPVVELATRRTLGFEALTRVSAGRFASPEKLFRVAQEQGALWKLERLARRRAVDGFPGFDPSQLLFLNLEPESIGDPELVAEEFLLELRRAGLRPEHVVLELTEHVEVCDFEAFRGGLARCRDAGFRIALDDVGAGYAGLKAIAEIRPDFLKIDIGIIRGVDRNPVKRELVNTIVDLAGRTGCTTVAEGVENPEELVALRAAGVRCAQGYLFARPARRPRVPDGLLPESPPRSE